MIDIQVLQSMTSSRPTTTTLPVTPAVVALDTFSTPYPTTPSSPHVFIPRRRVLLNPPTLKKHKHYCTSSSFLPINKTITNPLPYLDLNDDNDNDNDDNDQDQDQDTNRFICSSRNNNTSSFVFPPLPRITLKKRKTMNRRNNSGRSSPYCCLLLPRPQGFSPTEKEKEGEVVRDRLAQSREEEEEIEEKEVQEKEKIAALRRRQLDATTPSSFTTITSNDIIVDRTDPSKSITVKKIMKSSITSRKNNINSSMSAARSMSRHFSLQLMNNSHSDTAVATTANVDVDVDVDVDADSSFLLLSPCKNDNKVVLSTRTTKKSSLCSKIDYVINNINESS